MTKFGTNDMPL